MHKTRRGLRKKIQKALLQTDSKERFRDCCTNLAEAGREAFAGMDWEKLRGRVADCRKRALERLPSLVQRFTEEAERAGASVFLARQGEEVCEYLARLAESRQVQRIALGRSFTMREIDLAQTLRKKGFEVSETDISSWLATLGEGEPSHRIYPTLELSRQESARRLSLALGETVQPETAEIVQCAKAKMRTAILSAQMGITGANIAVAENGSLVIIENEGNARLLATLPSIQVVLMGLDKIVDRSEDAMSVLRVLARCASGERVTSSMTWIRGAVPYTEGGVEPRELHIVLLDNGRSEWAQDPWYQEVFQCIHCGACANVCPPFKRVGGQVFGDAYPGPIGLVMAGLLKPQERLGELLSLCNQCGACSEVCPGKLDIPSLILQLKQEQVERFGLPWKSRFALRGVLSKRRVFNGLMKLGSVIQKPLVDRDDFIRNAPLFNDQTRFRTLSALARRTFRDLWAHLAPRSIEKPIATVTLFVGCGVNFIYPEIGEAVVRVLRASGVQVLFPTRQTCCGSPGHRAGDVQTLFKLAQENVQILSDSASDCIITVCPSCAVALKHTYPALASDNEDWQRKTQEIAQKTKDFSEFLVDLLNFVPETRVRNESGDRELVTYHEPCHLARTLGVREQPKRLIRQLDGTEFEEMNAQGTCCGFGSGFSFSFPDLSSDILMEKLENIEATAAECVLTDCPGCVFQIRGGLNRRGSRIETLHTAEYLAWKMGLLG